MDDLLGGLSDFFGGVYSAATSALGAVGNVVTSVVDVASSAVKSLMPGLLGGTADLAASSPAAASLASEGIGSAASGGFAAPAAAAAAEASDIAPDPMQMVLGESAKSGGIDFASTVKPGPLTLDEFLGPAKPGSGGIEDLMRAPGYAGAIQGGTRGIIDSMLRFTKEQPVLTAAAAGGIKSMFSPNAIEVQREKARAELEAKLQLAQWLKDNNRAGGVGVNLNMRPAGAGAVQRMTGQPVYGQTGGLIAPYMRNA